MDGKFDSSQRNQLNASKFTSSQTAVQTSGLNESSEPSSSTRSCVASTS